MTANTTARRSMLSTAKGLFTRERTKSRRLLTLEFLERREMLAADVPTSFISPLNNITIATEISTISFPPLTAGTSVGNVGMTIDMGYGPRVPFLQLPFALPNPGAVNNSAQSIVSAGLGSRTIAKLDGQMAQAQAEVESARQALVANQQAYKQATDTQADLIKQGVDFDNSSDPRIADFYGRAAAAVGAADSSQKSVTAQQPAIDAAINDGYKNRNNKAAVQKAQIATRLNYLKQYAFQLAAFRQYAEQYYDLTAMVNAFNEDGRNEIQSAHDTLVQAIGEPTSTYAAAAAIQADRSDIQARIAMSKRLETRLTAIGLRPIPSNDALSKTLDDAAAKLDRRADAAAAEAKSLGDLASRFYADAVAYDKQGNTVGTLNNDLRSQTATNQQANDLYVEQQYRAQADLIRLTRTEGRVQRIISGSAAKFVQDNSTQILEGASKLVDLVKPIGELLKNTNVGDAIKPSSLAGFANGPRRDALRVALNTKLAGVRIVAVLEPVDVILKAMSVVDAEVRLWKAPNRDAYADRYLEAVKVEVGILVGVAGGEAGAALGGAIGAPSGPGEGAAVPIGAFVVGGLAVAGMESAIDKYAADSIKQNAREEWDLNHR